MVTSVVTFFYIAYYLKNRLNTLASISVMYISCARFAYKDFNDILIGSAHAY